MGQNCIICEQKIDDYGLLFCSKCRNKDWKLRFIAIQKKERKANGFGYNKGGSTKRGNIHTHGNTLNFRTYWERRRYERENK